MYRFPLILAVLALVLTTTSCKKDKEDDTVEDVLTLTTLCSYDIMVGGNSFQATADLTNNVTCNVTSSNNEVYGAYAGDFDGAYAFSIERGTFEKENVFDVPENDVFAAAFEVGTYPLSKNALDG